jgi:hypothetical protein
VILERERVYADAVAKQLAAREAALARVHARHAVTLEAAAASDADARQTQRLVAKHLDVRRSHKSE